MLAGTNRIAISFYSRVFCKLLDQTGEWAGLIGLNLSSQIEAQDHLNIDALYLVFGSNSHRWCLDYAYGTFF